MADDGVNLRASCRLREEGFASGSCVVGPEGGRIDKACTVTFRWEGNVPLRLIKSAHLSRPEHYFSIYQSGCHFACRKCPSWYFTQYASGQWMSPKNLDVQFSPFSPNINYGKFPLLILGRCRRLTRGQRTEGLCM